MQGCVDSRESLTGEDRPELSGTTKEVKKAVESARAALSLLGSTGTKAKRFCKKKAREAMEKALAKALDSKLTGFHPVWYSILLYC